MDSQDISQRKLFKAAGIIPSGAAAIGKLHAKCGVLGVRPQDVQNPHIPVAAITVPVVFKDHDPVTVPEVLVIGVGKHQLFRSERVDPVPDDFIQRARGQLTCPVIG